MTTAENNIGHKLLARAHSPASADKIFNEKVHLRPLLLKASEPSTTTPDARTHRRNKRLAEKAKRKKAIKPKPLSAREKRAIGIHEVSQAEQKYEIYTPLHHLWLGYMQEILGTHSDKFRGATQASAAMLCSADYHGAFFEVVRSRCPSRVGIKGIVARDTKYTFEIITAKNELKIVPKEHTVFRFEIPITTADVEKIGSAVSQEEHELSRRLTYDIHGDQFQHRAVDRSNKKHKPHWLPNI